MFLVEKLSKAIRVSSRVMEKENKDQKNRGIQKKENFHQRKKMEYKDI